MDHKAFSMASPQTPIPDPRVRMENDEYRVTAPNGKSSGARFFVNGLLVIEKKTKASLGEVSYEPILTLPKPSNVTASTEDMEDERQKNLALFSLLAGPGAE